MATYFFSNYLGELKTKLNVNSSNSGLPPFSDRVIKKGRFLRKKSKQSSGK